jgi:hypothetical protein
MNELMKHDSPINRLMRGLGRRLQAWGTQTPEDDVKKDYRWNDPQNESEALTFLFKRLQYTAEIGKCSKIALVGKDVEFSRELESLLSEEFSVKQFSSVSELIAHLQK